MIIPNKHIDSLNIVLILLTCAAAHYLPYHLLVFSYAMLGPAHYLTQISWLHDRKYFANSPLLAPLLLVLAALLITGYLRGWGDTFSAIIFGGAVTAALAYTLPSRLLFKAIAIMAGALLLLLISRSASVALFMAIVLPTVLHVFVFTAAFMWAGAMKSGRKTAYFSVFFLLAGAATFLIPGAAVNAPSLAGIDFFRPAVEFLKRIVPLSDTAETQWFGFLSFAYTYHYLNWFSKAEVIHWNKIPDRRLGFIIAIYTATIAAYMYDYVLGFLLILLLAQLHVLLEFPLNLRTFASIAQWDKKRKKPDVATS